MPSLSDAAVQDEYVASCAKAWKEWRSFGVGPNANTTRGLKLRSAVNRALQRCNVPIVGFVDGPSPYLLSQTWSIQFGGGYLNHDIDVDVWARGATTLYHEARHAEQWYLIAIGVAADKLLLPNPFGARPPVSAASISAGCNISINTATLAFNNRHSYPMLMDAQIRGWYRSIFGAYREHRGHVLQHLSWANYMNPAPDANFAQYLGLPEEKDAFLTQDEVLARLSNALEMWGKVTPSADAKNVISAGNTARLREKFGS